MVDGLSLLAHSLWIGGLALWLAIRSYTTWQKRQAIPGSPVQATLWGQAALLLCALGFLALSSSWLERVAWGMLFLLLGWPLIQRWVGQRGAQR